MELLATLLLMSILSLVAIAFLVALLLPLIMPVIQRQARANFTWRWCSQFISGANRKNSFSCKRELQLREESLGIVRFKCLDDEGLKERVECVFCLSNIEDGEEIRELRCRHIFHRSCLDEWLVHPGATCPLCRDALLQPTMAAKCDEVADVDDEEEEFDESYMILAAYFHTGWRSCKGQRDQWKPWKGSQTSREKGSKMLLRRPKTFGMSAIDSIDDLKLRDLDCWIIYRVLEEEEDEELEIYLL